MQLNYGTETRSPLCLTFKHFCSLSYWPRTYTNAALYLYPGLYYIACRGLEPSLMSDFNTSRMKYLQYAGVTVYDC